MYIDLAADCFTAALVTSFKWELFFPVMLAFDEYDKVQIFLYALVGGVAGLVIDYVLGYTCISVLAKGAKDENMLRYKRVSIFFAKYISWIILFCGFGVFDGLIAVFAGFFRLKFPIFLALVVLGKAGYYCYQIWYS